MCKCKKCVKQVDEKHILRNKNVSQMMFHQHLAAHSASVSVQAESVSRLIIPQEGLGPFGYSLAQ